MRDCAEDSSHKRITRLAIHYIFLLITITQIKTLRISPKIVLTNLKDNRRETESERRKYGKRVVNVELWYIFVCLCCVNFWLLLVILILIFYLWKYFADISDHLKINFLVHIQWATLIGGWWNVMLLIDSDSTLWNLGNFKIFIIYFWFTMNFNHPSVECCEGSDEKEV